MKYSQKAINWLESISKERGIKIRLAENDPHGELRIQNSYVDGFADGTIFEFLGCFWHGHDCDEKNTLQQVFLRDYFYIFDCVCDYSCSKIESKFDFSQQFVCCEKCI